MAKQDLSVQVRASDLQGHTPQASRTGLSLETLIRCIDLKLSVDQGRAVVNISS